MFPQDFQREVRETFQRIFGRTPLRERQEDILGEAMELTRATDFRHLKEELGDLLASSIQLVNELDLDLGDVLEGALRKIEERKLQYRSLSRKTYVAILGGAFDPPTLGHIDVAKYVLDTSRTFDEVWLMPCYGHMNNKEMAAPHQRLEMCNLAVQADRRIRVFDYEIANQLSGETYHTMKRLLEDPEYKDKYNFSLIIGMDRAMDFQTWVNYELLEQLVRFVVVPRPGYVWDYSCDWFLKPPHIFLGKSDRHIRETSSTEARRLVAYGKTVDYDEDLAKVMDKSVWEYVVKQRLYLNARQTLALNQQDVQAAENRRREVDAVLKPHGK